MGVVLAALHGVHKHYGDQVVLESATLELRASDRIALIGRNGSGKSTILKLLAGRETAEAGTTFRRDDAVVGMLDQDPLIDTTMTVLEASEQAFVDLDRLEARLAALEAEGLDDPDTYGRWEDLHETYTRRGGYERRARRDAVLHALGFRGREGTGVASLSGGERTRLGLARLLMKQPDVLLLDEPTNHLDMDMRAWLEVSRSVLRTFDGTPTQYREHRARQREIEERTRANQEKEAARLEAAAAQMKKWAGQNAKLHRRAKSMERRLERYEDDMVDAPEGPERTTRFSFPCEASAELVLHAEHLTKSYDAPLFEDVRVTVRSGERIGLVGPNGAGKTTFLKMLMGELASDDPRGHVRFGTRVRVGYYDQQLTGVDPDRTLIEEMVRLTGETEAHNLLGRFMFPFDAQYKKIRDLSGGERARLALLKLTMAERNMLVLDEPTNHLDVEMIEALEAALDAYQGTFVIVSHDRRFLEALATRVWEVRDGRFEDYEGDFAFYRRKRSERRPRPTAGAADASAPSDPPGDARTSRGAQGSGGEETSRAEERPPEAAAPRDGRTPWQLRREREALEERIERLERDLASVQERLARTQELPPDEIAELGKRHASLDEELLGAMQRWEEVDALLAGA